MVVRTSSADVRKAGESFGFFEPSAMAETESVLADYFPELTFKIPAKGGRGGRLGRGMPQVEQTITMKPREAVRPAAPAPQPPVPQRAPTPAPAAAPQPAAQTPQPVAPTPQPPAPTKTPEQLEREQTESTVRGLYKEYLGREPDEPGFKYWTQQDPRAQQGYSPTELTTLRKSFEESPEFLQRQKQSNVSAAYKQAFGREADEAGLKYWSANPSVGSDVESIKQQLISSAKATAGSEDRVRLAYREALGRDPDEAGLKYWSQQGTGESDFEKLKNQLRVAAGVR